MVGAIPCGMNTQMILFNIQVIQRRRSFLFHVHTNSLIWQTLDGLRHCVYACIYVRKSSRVQMKMYTLLNGINWNVSLTYFQQCSQAYDNPHPNVKAVLGHREVCHYGRRDQRTLWERTGYSSGPTKRRREKILVEWSQDRIFWRRGRIRLNEASILVKTLVSVPVMLMRD